MSNSEISNKIGWLNITPANDMTEIRVVDEVPVASRDANLEGKLEQLEPAR